MLSAPQIDFFAKKINIIEHYDEKYLKAAVYEMRLGSPAYRWQCGNRIKFDLASNTVSTYGDIQKIINNVNEPHLQYTAIDIKSSILILPPNSLTFVTTYEAFNLPKDIIARFNLKAKFVHMGLLLGTGPIVDPEFKAHLLIPLHNFSNSPITLKYKQPLISVEFTKTLNPDINFIVDRNVETRRNDQGKKTVDDFLKNADMVESSVYDALLENKRLVEKSDRIISRVKTFGIVALIAVLIAVFALLVSVFSLLSETYNELSNIKPVISKMQNKISTLEDAIPIIKKDHLALPIDHEQTINKKD